MSENKTGKYLKYAIGEIILVVIGILIALQINNWNENRKDNVRAQNYMHRISEDLKRSIDRSERLNEQTKSILGAITETQRLLERGGELTNEEQNIVDYAFLWFSRTTYQIPAMLTYEEMKESGDLNLIKNVEIRNELANFYSFLIQVESIYEKLSRNIENQFNIYNTQIRSYTNPETLDVTFKYDFSALSNDDVFINTFSRLAIHWRGFAYFMERMNQLSGDLKTKIDILR